MRRPQLEWIRAGNDGSEVNRNPGKRFVLGLGKLDGLLVDKPVVAAKVELVGALNDVIDFAVFQTGNAAVRRLYVIPYVLRFDCFLNEKGWVAQEGSEGNRVPRKERTRTYHPAGHFNLWLGGNVCRRSKYEHYTAEG